MAKKKKTSGYDKILKQKEDFLQASEERLQKQVSGLQFDLLNELNAEIINSLEIDEFGNITSDNIEIATKVDNVYDEFINNQGAKVAAGFSKDLLAGVDYNTRYYKSIAENHKKFDRISAGVKETIQQRIGITKGGEMIEDGFIERFVTDETIKNRIKEATFNAVTGGTSLKDFTKQLKEYVTGDDKVMGAFEKHYKTFAYDQYQQMDNIAGKLFANEMGLRCAIYQGGLIRDSRAFCMERNGKVFTKEEIAKFGTSEDIYGGYDNKGKGEFQGKSKPYNPSVDLGGYNCRHKLHWITDTLAIRLRPDLREFLKQAA